MRKAIIVVVSGIVFMITFALLIYPTPYRYFSYGENRMPVKYNVITGKTMQYSPTLGWFDTTNGAE